MVETPSDGEFPLIPVVAGAAGLVVLIAIVVVICCVVSKRGGGGGGGGSSARATSGGGGGNGIYASTQLSGTPEPITYSTLPSDQGAVAHATGKEVVAVEWEVDSDDE
jgi:hypothetical protein